jgi:formylmethanofuran dehydrogenase subunit E
MTNKCDRIKLKKKIKRENQKAFIIFGSDICSECHQKIGTKRSFAVSQGRIICQFCYRKRRSSNPKVNLKEVK